MNMTHENPKLAAVLLAAGPSSRLGQPKQLLSIEGESLVRRSSQLILAMNNIAGLTLVSGFESDRVEYEVEDLPVDIAYNRSWEQGMGASIACGVRKLPDGPDGVLLMVCDQWRLEKDDLSRLIAAWSTDISSIHVACWHEEKAFVSGPPVIFPRKIIPELISVDPGRGARQVIDRHMENVEFVKLENARFDLDNPEDLELIPGYCQQPSR